MNIFNRNNNKNTNYESDNESDLDISWVQEQEKLQHINENYFKEPMEMIDMFFIYINTNDYIEKINHLQQELSLNNNSGVIHNDIIIQLIEKNKFLSNNKYKIQDVLLYNVSLNPENIQSYSNDENILESSSKFLEPLSIINDFIIPPSIFIFHKINSIFFIFNQLQEVKHVVPKSILKSSIQYNDNDGSNNINNEKNTNDKNTNDKNTNDKNTNDKNTNEKINEKRKVTKKVRISEKNIITKMKPKNTITRKQKK